MSEKRRMSIGTFQIKVVTENDTDMIAIKANIEEFLDVATDANVRLTLDRRIVEVGHVSKPRGGLVEAVESIAADPDKRPLADETNAGADNTN